MGAIGREAGGFARQHVQEVLRMHQLFNFILHLPWGFATVAHLPLGGWHCWRVGLIIGRLLCDSAAALSTSALASQVPAAAICTEAGELTLISRFIQ